MTLKQTIFTVTALFAMGCSDGFSTQTFEFDERITHVSVFTDLGDVTIEGTNDVETATVEVELDCQNSVPDYSLLVENTHLVFEMKVPQGAEACDASITIRVPSLAALEIRTGRGDVVLQDTEGRTSIVNYDGDIELDNVSGALEVTAVSGNIAGTRMQSLSSEITLGAGNANLAYTKRPEVVDVDVLSGNSTLVVPSATYVVEASTEAGEVELDGISTDESASSTLVLCTNSGDIRIHGSL